jgi:hypothetical protein
LANQTTNRHIDIAKEFDLIVKEKLKISKKQPKDAEVYQKKQWLLFCEHPIWVYLAVSLVVLVLYLFLKYSSDSVLSRIFIFIYVLAIIFCAIALLLYSTFILYKSLDSLAFKWQKIAWEVKDAWPYSEEELLQAAKHVVYFRQQENFVCVTLLSFILTGLSILFPLKNFPNDWILPLLFAIPALLAMWFVIIFAPLAWRRSILFCLELEKQ